MSSSTVSGRVIGRVARVISEYYTHAQLDSMFLTSGYEVAPFDGNKLNKVTTWLRTGNKNLADPVSNLSELLEDFMEVAPENRYLEIDGKQQYIEDWRKEIVVALAMSNFRYVDGGKIVQLAVPPIMEPSDVDTLAANRENAAASSLNLQQTANTSKAVFLVHGHNEAQLQTTARLIETLGLQPIILRERPNSGATLIEKFEQHSGDAASVNYAVVLMTADDAGESNARVREGNLRKRARQNVLLEMGYFIGRLGRERICVLKSAEVEEPSDIFGVVYTLIDENGAWRYELGRELKAAGYEIDLNVIP